MKTAAQSFWLDLDEGPIDTTCAQWRGVLARYLNAHGFGGRFWMSDIRDVDGHRQIEVMFEDKAVALDDILAARYLNL